MSTMLKHDKEITDRYNILVQELEAEELPSNVRLCVSEPDTFSYVLVEATVSTKIIGLNITVDLLHVQVNLLELRTAEEINDKAWSLAEEARHKYNQIFTDPQDLPRQ